MGLGFLRPQVRMFLVTEQDLQQCHSERKPYPVIGSMTNECSFNMDLSGCCKAEFHNIHVEKLQPQNGRNAAVQKYAFVFRTTVNICNSEIHLEVSPTVHFFHFLRVFVGTPNSNGLNARVAVSGGQITQ